MAEAVTYLELTMEMEQNVFGRIDENRAEIFKRLNSFIKFKTISKQAKFAAESKMALDATKHWLRALGFIITGQRGDQENDTSTEDGTIFASYFAGFENVTVLIYAELNTPPAEKSDGWSSDPHTLSTRDNMLYGRGVTSGKGQLLCWLHALEAWQAEIGKLPLNVKFIITSGYYSHSIQLDAQLTRLKDFFADVDYVMMFNNSWVNGNQPFVLCNINGLLQFGVQVKSIYASNAAATHGYQFVHTAFNDLCRVMNSLVSTEHNIFVPEIESHISQAERLLLNAAECNLEKLMAPVKDTKLQSPTTADWFARRWCRPTLSINDVLHPLSLQGKTLYTPASAMATFSIRLVPEQNTRQVATAVKDFLKLTFKNLHSTNQINITVLKQYASFYCDRRSSHITAVCRALQRTHNVKAALPTSICHCVPIALLLRAHCKKPFIFVPYTKFNASATAVNECMHVEFYLRNVKLAASMLWEIAQLHDKGSALKIAPTLVAERQNE